MRRRLRESRSYVSNREIIAAYHEIKDDSSAVTIFDLASHLGMTEDDLLEQLPDGMIVDNEETGELMLEEGTSVVKLTPRQLRNIIYETLQRFS